MLIISISLLTVALAAPLKLSFILSQSPSFKTSYPNLPKIPCYSSIPHATEYSLSISNGEAIAKTYVGDTLEQVVEFKQGTVNTLSMQAASCPAPLQPEIPAVPYNTITNELLSYKLLFKKNSNELAIETFKYFQGGNFGEMVYVVTWHRDGSKVVNAIA